VFSLTPSGELLAAWLNSGAAEPALEREHRVEAPSRRQEETLPTTIEGAVLAPVAHR
jgi:hypothetical protein